MFHWQKEAEQYIPEELSGYDFVRSYPVFIPYKEVRLTILERQLVAIPFVQECIMSAISAGTHDIGDLSAQFGVSEEIMVQIISQLDSLQLASVSAGRVVLTGQGKNILKSQQRVQISRDESSLLYMNQISGKITDKRPAHISQKQPPRAALYLDEEYPADLDFFRAHFDQVAEICNANSTASAIFGHSTILEATLYRITGVAYERLFYVRERCSVYINQQDRSLRFRFASGDELYEKAMSNQLRDSRPGAARLLASRRLPSPGDGRVKPGLPTALIDAFKAHSDSQEKDQVIESAYFQSRPLLDGEIADMLENCRDLRAKAVYLSLPICGDYLSDVAISAITANAERLILSYDPDDRSAEAAINRIRKILADKRSILELRKDAAAPEVRILLGDTCGISATYSPRQTVYRRTIYRIDAKVTYDREEVKHLWETADRTAYVLLYENAAKSGTPHRKKRYSEK